LTSSSTGVQIYYTTDGTVPTTASIKYADTAISVPVGETIQAIAVESGHPTSATSSATYVIGVASSPTFSPAAGTYSTAQNVSLGSATTGATIYFTTDGSVPTTASTKYSGAAIPVVASESIQAIAVAGGMATSPVANAAYGIGSTSAPTFAPAAGTYSSVQTVVLSSATSGATIYYTLDGSSPTSASTKYNDTAIAVTGSETIKAIAIANGFTSSPAVAVYTISILGQTTSPTFTPPAGTYSTGQSVGLSCATSGSTIYYTVDGSQPTTASSVYTAPISVITSETIKAVAVAAGSTNSLVAIAAYTIQLPAAAPTLNPVGGTYTAAQSVALASTTPGAVIYYTLDGTAPTTSSSVYSTPLGVGANETIKAIAVATNYGTSSVSSAVYTIAIPGITESPTFSPVAGSYTSAQSVTLASATGGATIYYTVDGSAPTASSNVYSAPIAVSATETIKAIATSSGNSNSQVASAAYTIQLPAASPTATPAGGVYTSAQTVTLSSATSGATIYYTLDGTSPTTSSSVYSAPITVAASETIKAIAVATGFTNSAVGTAAYVIQPPAAAPTFSPVAGTYTSVQSVALSSTTAGATIYYTLDRSAPTTGSTLYAGPISVNANETVKAIALGNGFSSSAVAGALYTITLPTSTPTFLPASGPYTSVQNVTLSSATLGAAIYYTTDGSAPTTSSTKYTATISVGTSETIKAIAVATGYTTSPVATAAYTITFPTAVPPAFAPAAGTYTTAQKVSLSTSTPGATIYYTTNGNAPTATSTAYASAPITVNNSETIKAITVANGYTNSTVNSASYVINYDVTLKSLTVSGDSVPLVGGTTLTADSLPGLTKQAAIFATANDGNASIKINNTNGASGNVAITKDSATVKIVVTNGGASATYTLKLNSRHSGTISDPRDGQTYQVVKVGTQWWMARNLNFAGALGTTGVCYGNDQGNCGFYGHLYTWAEAMNGASSSASSPSGVQGVCPVGWHFPSGAEWNSLISFVGSSTAGSSLKSSTSWDGTDSYLFGVLPAGYNDIDNGSSLLLGSTSMFWSSTENVNDATAAINYWLFREKCG
jgi:uncharacterized protein (TIGR02145 family)